jgi:hypothetical protein
VLSWFSSEISMPSFPIAAALLAAATLSFVVRPAWAQAGDAPAVTSTSATRAPAVRDPLDPRAAVPPLHHRSALAAYRAVQDSKPTAWREANDTTARVGGWRAYARQAQASDGASLPAMPAAATPAGHGPHHGQ